ncbi:Glutathione synthetase [Acetobacteraceae bacterium EV16G]|uniref:Glutathione synthetase n=1 Tax=Sorlinia euscelidii TaxID=3081148 RepID=A0ABU7U3X5_9PROT
MTLDIAFQMDPLEEVNIDGDSTFALMLEAQARGHNLHVYDFRTLAYGEDVAMPDPDTGHGALSAVTRAVQVKRRKGRHAFFGPPQRRRLTSFDVVWMRQDPPFDMGYISATYMLEQVDGAGRDKVRIFNHPRAVRDAPEKLLPMQFPDLMPPTLVSWDIAALTQFRKKYGDVILKPLYGNGGVGIFRVREDDENFASLLEMHFSRGREPLMIQRYEAKVRDGDKRIILVDGVPIGAINRVPQLGEARSNMHVGGKATAIPLSERDQEICAKIGPYLRENNLIFVGIDVIGHYLTEINVTSPTGLQELDHFNGVNSAGLIWDAVEARL